jgi:NADH dehydrogenase [ubiquinone] 1 alpha subcomplex assembly factor 3
VYSEGYQKPHMTRIGLDDTTLQITTFNQFGFSINKHIKVLGPILIFPKTIFSWNIEDTKEINEKSLSIFKLIQPRVDVLVIGIGDKYEKVNPDVPKWLIQNKINNFEILPTVTFLFL